MKTHSCRSFSIPTLNSIAWKAHPDRELAGSRSRQEPLDGGDALVLTLTLSVHTLNVLMSSVLSSTPPTSGDIQAYVPTAVVCSVVWSKLRADPRSQICVRCHAGTRSQICVRRSCRDEITDLCEGSCREEITDLCEAFMQGQDHRSV